jgi:endonuclease-8
VTSVPEGDTIFRTATSLRRWIGGREVTAARGTVPGVHAASLVGTTVEEVEARAKHLLIRFSDGRALHTHMRMTGSWHVYPTGERWRKPARQARIVIETGPRLAVCFNAPVVELLAAGAERAHGSLRRLGPDVLVPATLDPVAVRARAAARAVASPTAGELLLDQQVVSGIGNIYRCESLFLCGVHPRHPSADLDAATVDALVATASRLMGHNAGLSSISRSFDGGPDRPWVYGRHGQPCRRCGTPVARELLGDQARSVYWCPTCQPAPAPR